MSGTAEQAVSMALQALNFAINVSASIERYRQVVAAAVAEGRDISDTELEQAANDLDAAIERAAGPTNPPPAPNG